MVTEAVAVTNSGARLAGLDDGFTVPPAVSVEGFGTGAAQHQNCCTYEHRCNSHPNQAVPAFRRRWNFTVRDRHGTGCWRYSTGRRNFRSAGGEK